MDNAFHAVPQTALLHTLLSDFRWDGTLTFIHNVFVFLGAAVKRRRKRDQNSTKQLCLGKETIYQKRGVIYASLLALTPTVRVSSHLRPASSGNCSRRSITAPKDRYAALCNQCINSWGDHQTLLGVCFISSVQKRLNSTDKYRDTNEWCLSL